MVVILKKGEALERAKGWKERRDTIWADGSRRGDKRIGVAAAWWEGAHRPPYW